jgi:hypothetical protein
MLIGYMCRLIYVALATFVTFGLGTSRSLGVSF